MCLFPHNIGLTIGSTGYSETKEIVHEFLCLLLHSEVFYSVNGSYVYNFKTAS